MLIKLINKLISIQKSILKNILIFLVNTYFKLVLRNFREVHHYKIDLYNIHIELHEINIEIKTILG